MIPQLLKRNLRLVILVSTIIFSILIYIFRARFMGLTGYGLLGLFLISLIGSATIIVPVPVFVAAFVAGAVFNPILVAVIVSFGASLGEITGYLAGYGAEEIIQKEVRLQRIKKWMDKYGLWVVFALAAIPNPIFDLAGIVSGATEIPIQKFLIVTFLGKLIRFALIAYLGAHSISLIDKFI